MRILNQAVGLAASLLLAFAAAAIGGVASASAPEFYRELTRPAWAPPAWLFGPVWTVLYLLMGIAAWLVWRERGFGGARTALSLFLVQLAANALWSWLFFAWRQGALAFVEIVILWALILATVVAFWRVRPLAGALLVPYLAWVSFATALYVRHLAAQSAVVVVSQGTSSHTLADGNNCKSRQIVAPVAGRGRGSAYLRGCLPRAAEDSLGARCFPPPAGLGAGCGQCESCAGMFNPQTLPRP